MFLFETTATNLAIQTSAQAKEGNLHSQTTFYPFGAYFTGTGHDVTDRGFTGHRHNDELGLIYMVM